MTRNRMGNLNIDVVTSKLDAHVQKTALFIIGKEKSIFRFIMTKALRLAPVKAKIYLC